ncbi:MAG: hypothetical protein LBT08_05320 [Synergistaceae bacterium]|nr:hypothetical protein [Synergistaceae bacterium]
MRSGFLIISFLLTALIIGWLAATQLGVLTGGVTVGQMTAPASGDVPSGAPRLNPMDRAREIVSIDRTRQTEMERLMKK